jgi:aspartyl protease family protein
MFKTPTTHGRATKLVAATTALAVASGAISSPAHAGGNGAGIALGIIGGIIAGAAAANANRPQLSYYPQPAYAGNSAACQSWLAVLNDPRYDAATRAQAQQVVSGCGLPYSIGGGPAAGGPPLAYAPAPTYTPAPAYAASATPATGSTEIALISNGSGSHYVNGTVNGAAVQFVLDTGAEVTTIPLTFAQQLAHQGRLSKADIRGVASFGMANGSAQKELVVTLASITIGGRTVHNVTAAISPAGSAPLLGQTFLQHFGSYTIDNRRNVLALG